MSPSTPLCPCGSLQPFATCCAPYLIGEKVVPTAEALMRARYTAFTRADIAFLKNSLHPKHRSDFDEKTTTAWAENATWEGLEIKALEGGQEHDRDGTVEFVANYTIKDVKYPHHEIGKFKKEGGAWYFVDGRIMNHNQVIRDTPKVGRNDPCSCNSGKKYKKCCGQ